MADDSLTERDNSFNQLSPSSRSSAAFQSSERIAKLEITSSLLAKAQALMAMAFPHALSECSHNERYYYLAVIAELIEDAFAQIDDMLTTLRQEKVK